MNCDRSRMMRSISTQPWTTSDVVSFDVNRFMRVLAAVSVLGLIPAVIGGLLTSLFLTLVVVPAAYDLFDDMAGFFKKRGAKKHDAISPLQASSDLH